MKFSFRVIQEDRNSPAKVGKIKTVHGEIETPAFIPVGTQATVKSLTPDDLSKIGVQIILANTYHLYLRPGAEVVQKLGGLHKFMGWNRPIMSDSGGFQIFSLGRGEREDKLYLNLTADQYSSKRAPSLPFSVKIDYNGVTFQSHLDGSAHRFTPEKSIEIQQKLGADMIVAFDECTPYPVDYKYAQIAMKRTHDWALRSLKAAQGKPKQALFGVVQGSVFKDLREESAKFISDLAVSPSTSLGINSVEGFDGIAIGGVAVGESKKEMYQVLDWVMPVLEKQKVFNHKPIHLLGVGEIDDIFEGVGRGVDMMDCVMPTRLGRMGHILSKLKIKNEKLKITDKNLKFTFDITKSVFVDDPEPLDKSCDCFVCRNFTRAYLNHLFRTKELLAYRLATYHNLYFMEKLFSQIREAIKKGEFLKLKKRWLGSRW